jgi:ribonuclease E
MCVHTNKEATHIATLEGRSMVEYTVAKGADETNQIDGNIYLGRIQNVLPGMELAFVDIGIPKNGVLYRGDVTFEAEEVEGAPSNDKRIEEMIKSGQTIICQVTKNAIGAKGARLTQEVSIPGRFAVLVPNSSTIGISKRLPDGERRRLRKIIDDVKPERRPRARREFARRKVVGNRSRSGQVQPAATGLPRPRPRSARAA